MTIYHINKGIGRASSGIEYAQKYRHDLVKGFPEKQYFVFCDYLSLNYINYTDKMGFDMDKVLNAYKFMAGQLNHRSTYTVEDFQATIPEGFTETERTQRAVVFKYDRTTYKVWLIEENGMVDRIDTIQDGKLLEVAHYSDRLTSIDYYEGADIVSRYFFDEMGNLTLRQFYREREITLTFTDDGKVLQGRNAFYQEFFRRLNFSEADLIIIDRNKDVSDALFPQRNGAKTVIVIHAEHYNAARTTEDWIAWNNFYEYPFMNHQYVDYFVVSTDKQNEVLSTQFEVMGLNDRPIWTIPVGSVAKISDGHATEANKYKMMTASRLAWEKHIDILILAVVEAKKRVPELTFAIYGEGKFRKDLSDLIKEHKAQDYITLEGHKNLSEEYAKYGGYLTASGSEGFGLSILEAVAATLPIVGLEVNYGNTEFVKNGVNGLLVPATEAKEQVVNLTESIVKMVNTLDYQAAIDYAISKASDFTDDKIQAQWRALYDHALNQKGEQA